MTLTELKSLIDKEIERLWSLYDVLSEICIFSPGDDLSQMMASFIKFNNFSLNNDFVDNANLFLNSNELGRFHQYAINQFQAVFKNKERLKRQFDERVLNGFSRKLNSSDSLEIEKAFFEVFIFGIPYFQLDESPNPNFINNIVSSTDCIFDKLYSRIENLSAKNNLAKLKEINEKYPETFKDLFHDGDLMPNCIDILKKLTPPLIDSENNYIGNLKGTICIWVEEMKREGIMKHYSDRKIYANLVPQVIHRFTIDESMFGKFQKRAEEKYKTDIKVMLSSLKLSQSSQKRELGE